MSLRLPPVTEKASGTPVASTRRCCLEPGRPLSTGLGPVSEPVGFINSMRLQIRRIGKLRPSFRTSRAPAAIDRCFRVLSIAPRVTAAASTRAKRIDGRHVRAAHLRLAVLRRALPDAEHGAGGILD